MASSSRGIRILLGVLVGVLVLMLAAGILLAWLAPNASHPIDVEMPQQGDPSAALHMACSPRAACASTPLASR